MIITETQTYIKTYTNEATLILRLRNGNESLSYMKFKRISSNTKFLKEEQKNENEKINCQRSFDIEVKFCIKIL